MTKKKRLNLIQNDSSEVSNLKTMNLRTRIYIVSFKCININNLIIVVLLGKN